MCSVNFWHQQDSNLSFKGNIGHVTYKCEWPIPGFWFLRKSEKKKTLWVKSNMLVDPGAVVIQVGTDGSESDN